MSDLDYLAAMALVTFAIVLGGFAYLFLFILP